MSMDRDGGPPDDPDGEFADGPTIIERPDESDEPRAITLDYLRGLRNKGQYIRGADLANDFYELLLQSLPEGDTNTDLTLMQIVDEGGWMEYLLVEPGRESFLQSWSERAEDLFLRFSRERTAVSRPGDFDISRRIQTVTAEFKMKLQKIRLAWKVAITAKDPHEKHQAISDAQAECDWLLNEFRMFQTPDSGASEMQRALIATLNEDLEYGATVAEAKRMKAVMSGAAYLWHPDYSLCDQDAAEKTLADDPNYVGILRQTADLLRDYFEFFRKHPELGEPPQYWYACMERIRHLKMLRRFGDAHRIANEVLLRAERAKNEIFCSRVKNLIAETKITLGQRFLQSSPMHAEYRALEEQAIGILKIPAGQNKAKLLELLFEKGREDARSAMETDDHHSRRTARGTAADSVLSICGHPTIDPGHKQFLLSQMWGDFIGREENNTDDLWCFNEAPNMAALWLQGHQWKSPLPLPSDRRMSFLERFRVAFEALEIELARKKPNVPWQYYVLIQKQRDDIEKFLEHVT